MRGVIAAMLAAGLLAACDPAGPATVGLIPVGVTGDGADAAPTGDGAPLDAMKTDASPLASSSPMAVDPAQPAAEGTDASALAAAATAAVSDAPSAAAAAPGNAALAAYAQSASHAAGTPVHGREFASPDRAQRACARYADNDQAQSAFLAAGGPAQDPRGLDPDGDGYACGWDPVTFRGESAG